MNKRGWILMGITIALIIASIAVLNNDRDRTQSDDSTTNGEDSKIGMPNTASVYCEEQGGEIEIVSVEDGSQYGVCVFDNGVRCDEWEYYQGKCGCQTDSDCVKDSCCHAKSCVMKDKAPVCKDVMCTQNCVPDTLDCGGSCKCIDNHCEGVGIFEESE